MDKRIVLVFAHPDDESFTCGGTIAKYAASGWGIYVVCLTGGEAGQSGGFGEISKATLRKHRIEEFTRACKCLGVASHRVLEYKDGAVAEVEAGEIEDILYRYFMEVSPRIVITFEPRGIS